MDVPMIIWASIAAAAIIIELFTYTFFALSFTLSALVVLILAAVGVPMQWQVVTFVVLSLVIIGFLQPIMKRLFNKKMIATNMDANIGKKIKLLEDVEDDRSTAILGDVTWTVICDEALKKGAVVEITGTEGNKLLVKGGK